MKILLDNIIYSLQKSGGASVVWTEHLKRLVKDTQFNSYFIEYNNARDNIFRQNLSLTDAFIERRSSIGLKLFRYIDVKSQIEEEHLFHSSHYRIDKNPSAKNITTVHDFVYEKYVSGFRQKVHSAQKWHAIRKADAVICISESTKRDLLTYLPDVNENKVYVVHNGVNSLFRKMKTAEYKLKLPFETNEYAIYVGSRHVPYKNFATVIKICKQLNIPLIMVGGEYMGDKETAFLTDQLGQGHFTSMRGTSNEDLNELYNRACILLYPSLYEGFGIPVIEAQRCGCPVLCMESSSIPEIAGDSELCMPIGSSIAEICSRIGELIRNTSFLGKEISKGLENSQRFSWDKTYKQTTDVYRLLMC